MFVNVLQGVYSIFRSQIPDFYWLFPDLISSFSWLFLAPETGYLQKPNLKWVKNGYQIRFLEYLGTWYMQGAHIH